MTLQALNEVTGQIQRYLLVQLFTSALVGLAALGVYLLNAHLFSVDNAVRYSCATLITAVVMAGLLLPKWTRMGAGGAWLNRRIVLGTVLITHRSGLTRTTASDVTPRAFTR